MTDRYCGNDPFPFRNKLAKSPSLKRGGDFFVLLQFDSFALAVFGGIVSLVLTTHKSLDLRMLNFS